MSFKFQFDPAGVPMTPTIILASHSGKLKHGAFIAPYTIHCTDGMLEPGTLDFTVNKNYEPLWDKVENFKLVYVMEWDTWLQVQLALIDGTSVEKRVQATSLCKSELSQLLLHGHEYNTDDDIAREDYKRALIYTWDTENYNSILTDIFSKAPHYTLEHVDPSIASMQKTFTFDNVSIDDALQEIAKECNAVVVYNDGMNPETNMPARGVSLYDLESVCNNKYCKHRGEFSLECPQCGSTDIDTGYGEDTTIFVTKDNLTQEVELTSNLDNIKNCFKLQAGDDVMTSAIQSCNPNGTDYIWHFNDEMLNDMSEELRDKINQYDEEYKYYQLEYSLPMDDAIISKYNGLVDKYIGQKSDLKYIDKSKLIGYPALMNEMFDVIDFELFIDSALMPVGKEATGTTAQIEAAKLSRDTLSPVAITSRYNITPSLIDTMVLGLARLSVDKRYDVKIKTSQLQNVDNENKTAKWVGGFTVTNTSDEDDTADTEDTIQININTNYERYIKQRVAKVLNAEEDKRNYDVAELLKPDTSLEEFTNEIKYYNLATLMTVKDSCDTVLDTIMGENYISSQTYYSNYYKKAAALIAEIKTKEDDKAAIVATEDELTRIRNEIQEHLNFEKYLGEDLFNEFCTYRRENVYKNDHYISDGLTNEQLFQNAREFFNTAEKEIFKSSTRQHSINATLKNLLAIPGFEPLREHFQLGNWLRILIDGEVYKLRLIRYSVNFDEIENLTVEFSDVLKGAHGFYDVENLLKQMSSMTTSYDTVMRQATKAEDVDRTITNWFTNGLDATLTRIVDDSGQQDVLIDNHGIQIRDYDPVTDDYKPTQMKFINSILAITDDNWEHIRTAVGNFVYQDPITQDFKEAYGINAETVVGNLILGQNLRIHNINDEQEMNFVVDKDGVNVYNDMNEVKINPNSENLIVVKHDDEKMLWLDEKGMLHIAGDGAGLDISANSSITGLETNFSVTAGEIRSEISSAQSGLTSYINQTADAINTRVGDIASGLSASIEQTQSSITAMVQDVNSGLSSQIAQNANSIQLVVESQNNMRAQFEVSLEGILSQVQDTTNNLRSQLIQTAEQIRSEVTAGNNALSSSINQTASEIRSEVADNNTGLQTLISQTADAIRSEVSSANGAMQSSITQHESQIQALVQQGNDLYSSITQTADQIRTEVTSKTDNLQSSITQNAGMISLVVKGNDGESGLQITEEAITAIASDIKTKGLFTVESINGLGAKIEELVGESSATLTTDYHKVFYQDDPPSTLKEPLKAGDIWYQTDNVTITKDDGETTEVQQQIVAMNRYSGTKWEPYVAGTTVIGDGVITTDMIAAGAITAKKFAGAEIRSLNYATSGTGADTTVTAGMLIALAEGAIYTPNTSIATNGYFKTVNGEIGGWKIEDNTLVSSEFNGVTVKLAPGQGSGGGAYDVMSVKKGTAYPFWINSDGYMHASAGDMGGMIFSMGDNGSEIKVGQNGVPININSAGGLSVVALNTYGDISVHDGNIYIDNSPIATSDKRLKTNWESFDSRYENAFMELQPVKYMYKNFTADDTHDRCHCGFLAQDVEEVFNRNDISTDELGLLCIRLRNDVNRANNLSEYGLRYEEFISLNTHMIQKTIHENEQLKAKLAELESRIDYLMNK